MTGSFNKYIVISIVLLLSALSFWSCNKCKNIDCFSPPEPFSFKLLDKNSGQDLIHNGSYAINEIQLISDYNNAVLDLQIDTSGINVLFTSGEIGFQSGEDKKDYTLKVGDERIDFIYLTESKTVNCCGITELIEIDFGSVALESNTVTNIYSIKL